MLYCRGLASYASAKWNSPYFLIMGQVTTCLRSTANAPPSQAFSTLHATVVVGRAVRISRHLSKDKETGVLEDGPSLPVLRAFCSLRTRSFSSPSTMKVVQKNLNEFSSKHQNLIDSSKGATPAGGKGKARNLLETVLPLSTVKEEVYKALDEWVAFELEFPVTSVRIALRRLKYREEWQKLIQVSKWMLSKGQGKTLGTYNLMITAYDMLDRLDEMNNLWENVIVCNARSTPKAMFIHMMHIYRRRGMLEKFVKLFEQMEEYGMNPDKDIVSRVGEAYQELGMLEKKEKLMTKYLSASNSLSTSKEKPKGKKKRVIPSLKVKSSNAENSTHFVGVGENSNSQHSKMIHSMESKCEESLVTTIGSSKASESGSLSSLADLLVGRNYQQGMAHGRKSSKNAGKKAWSGII